MNILKISQTEIKLIRDTEVIEDKLERAFEQDIVETPYTHRK